ncbi:MULTISPECIES: HRDC domain-containing protein [unclassified Paenibacillus]|uniref:HRDC domain-containing protein n=1 Tax=unclassified Paenibacillus TaxID=185978 RepID=UPI00095533D0|nr:MULTISPECIES: HRDC domain-containing protein [unclassified Paenibacillus]ASS68952.1 aldolase [Paenibacillus sp. RUD330]SIR13486.1 HRDC domain-containing protein [Paenibacillus sp. RU4X]SIR24158.1 HRDC domain-containing protein [Paenibacillus sp. RU4T]
MQIVFLNSFEKPLGDGRIDNAQLSICEQQGTWSVVWNGARHGSAEPSSVWYEGSSWEEMITAFRHGVAVRMGEGFTPLIDGMLDERPAGKGGIISMQQCYGELHADHELFEALRDWRRIKASSEKKSAYLVATNRTLLMISSFVPHTLEELAQIPGWGPGKSREYGKEVLELTGARAQARAFPLSWVSEALEPKAYIQWLYKQKETKFKNKMDRQQCGRLILEGINQERTLEQLLADTGLQRRELMERIEQLEQEGYDLEPLIAKELEGISQEEQQRIWEALKEEGDKYLKPILQKVYGAEPAPSAKVDLIYDRLRLVRMRFRRSAAGGGGSLEAM